MNDELFELLDNTGKENRTAFIAALIMDRCLEADAPIGNVDDVRNLPRFNPYQAERIARTLVTLAGRIHAYAELACNRELLPTEERSSSKYRDRFAQIATLCGLTPTTGGDPRGACAYLADPANPKDGDDMGGRGWGVYR
jgi:hypothetical protein